MKIYYIILLNYQLTGHPENLKIKLYYFQERLNIPSNQEFGSKHNPKVTVSVSYMFLAK